MSSEDENFSAASTVILWNSVLTVVAKQGRGPDVGEQAEALLRRMMMISPSSLPATLTTNTTLVQPNEISYACVLEAWAGTAPSNPHAGTNAERLLREMIVTCGKLRRRQQQATRGGNENAATVATGVSSSSSPFHEDNTTSFHGGTNSSMSVDTAASTCYLHVLRAWSKCTHHPDGADRANQILQGMVRHYLRQTNDSNDDDTDDNEMEYYPNVKPSRHCFSAVMSGYADRGQPENVEQLLGELQTLYQSSGGDPLLYPTTAVFNSVLEAYVQQGTPASAARAQQLLERLYQTAVVADNTNHSQFYRLCLPDTTSVNTCIHGWAESGAPDAVERAEALLVAASEWTGVSPDPYSYTTVMKAWSRSDRPEAAERCEQILRSMWERYEQSTLPDDTTSTTVWKKLKPNHVTYSTAIYTWSIATHNPDAPLRAEAIYQDMLKRYQNGDRDLKPTLSIFLALITAWAHSNRKESDVRAQVYFDQMRGLYMAGDDSVRPTDKVYNALIASKKRLNDGEGAEQILKHMYDDYLNHGNKAARPNRFVFHNVMSAWANSKRPDANHRIEAMLIQMQKEHETRKWDCKPNRMDFNILLTSLGKLKSRESAKRAESVLRHMYALSEASGDNGVKPNSHCCATALNAWASTIHVPEAPLHAKAIFDDMWRRFEAGDQDLKPCGQCYSALLTTWAKSNHVEAGRRALVILNEMEDRHAIDATHKPPGPYHYTAVINAFANSGDVDNAERVLQRIANRGDIRVHRTSLNAVLKAYSRWTGPEMVERAVQLLHDMRSVYLHSPDVVSYTTFLLCLQRSRRPDAYASGKSVVEQMVLLSDRGETAVTPNVATFATLLATLNESCTMSLADKIHEAEDITTLMDHVRVQPTTSILQELHRIRQHK